MSRFPKAKFCHAVDKKAFSPSFIFFITLQKVFKHPITMKHLTRNILTAALCLMAVCTTSAQQRYDTFVSFKKVYFKSMSFSAFSNSTASYFTFKVNESIFHQNCLVSLWKRIIDSYSPNSSRLGI